MKLENQVCSLELSKQLKSLGVKQDSLFFWIREKLKLVTDINYPPSGKELFYNEGFVNDMTVCYSAFTVAELGEMLPIYCTIQRTATSWLGSYTDEMNCHIKKDDTEANARAKMLIYLIKQGLVKGCDV